MSNEYHACKDCRMELDDDDDDDNNNILFHTKIQEYLNLV